MTSNFEVLKNNWPHLYDLASMAEDYVYTDPQSTVAKIRLLAEKYVDLIASTEKVYFDYNDKQYEKLKELEYRYILDDEAILKSFHRIRKVGNNAIHEIYDDTDKALAVLRSAHMVTNWFVEVYGDYDQEINPTFINPVKIDYRDRTTNEELEAEYNRKLEELKKEVLAQSDKEFEEAAKKRRKKSQAYITNADLSEEDTRILFIDTKLREAGWEADSINLNWSQGTRPEEGKNLAIAEVPVDGGSADYMLFIGLKPVAIVEAKKFGKDVSSDLAQAKIYSENLKPLSFYTGEGNMGVAESDVKRFNTMGIPYIYASNGRDYIKQLESKSGIWFFDKNSDQVSKPIGGFHSPANLSQKLEQDKQKAKRELAIEDYPDFASRYYQKEAIAAVDHALAEGKDRMLLALATGTGKTRLAISLMYRLIKTKTVRRVLFLVDRKALGIQTQDALTDLEVEGKSISDIYNIKTLAEAYPEIETKIQVATVQGMVRRLFYQEDDSKIPSAGDYDFIIVDEAHRGYIEDKDMTDEELEFKSSETYLSQYRRVIEYFDAKVLGLTATPALHTTEIFGPPIYTYSYKKAVVDGYLVDYEPPYTLETELNQNGINFAKGSEVEVYQKSTGTVEKYLLEDELNFDVDQFNRRVHTESFNRVVIRELSKYIDPQGPGKTLVFAASEEHADLVVRIFKEELIDAGYDITDDTVQKIMGTTYKQDEAIKKFKNEKNPNIVVTVDLLTTGIDVPEIVNLVFLRRVKSRILFEQMIGRATRLAPDIGKDYFRVYDPVGLFDQLEEVTDMKPVVKDSNQTVEDILVEIENADHIDQFNYLKDELIAKLQSKKQRLTEESIKEVEELLEIEDLDAYLSDLKDMDQEKILSFYDDFITIAKKRNSTNEGYIISHHEDKLIGVTRDYGKDNIKPDDYLENFKKFIEENANLVEALNLVITSPKDLKHKDLSEIRLILKEANFDEVRLNQAWKDSRKDYITADIISFIRQAALGEDLEDHAEKVAKAMRKVYSMHPWTPQQMNLLNKIESQLLATPVLAPSAKEYFDGTALWKERGGYNFMQNRFGDDIEIIIDTINESLYS